MEKGNLMMIVIIVLLVALLGTVVGVTFYAFNMVQQMEAAGQGLGDWDRTPRELRIDQINRVLVGDAIITNLASDAGGSSGTARIQVVVGYDNTQGRESDNIARQITEQLTTIRTIALEAIQNSTYQELTARDAMANLGADILLSLQNQFMTNMIVEVRFNEWIVQ